MGTVPLYLGVDGGGTKTALVLLDAEGTIRATHLAAGSYYLTIGVEALGTLLVEAVTAILAKAAVSSDEVDFAFFGLPAYGEDTALIGPLSRLPQRCLPAGRYLCGNDMICGWAGSLLCRDGISIVAGTGSICYGERKGSIARCGGWGELFSDEGSAYWIARRGLNLFSRMSDGRVERGPLYDILRRHFELQSDLDLCAAIYDQAQVQRSNLAALAPLVAEAARHGDVRASALFTDAAGELAQLVDAVHRRLAVPPRQTLSVSYSGGLFQQRDLLLAPLLAHLASRDGRYRVVAPRLPPAAGAALYAAKCSGAPLSASAIGALETHYGRA